MTPSRALDWIRCLFLVLVIGDVMALVLVPTSFHGSICCYKRRQTSDGLGAWVLGSYPVSGCDCGSFHCDACDCAWFLMFGSCLTCHTLAGILQLLMPLRVRTFCKTICIKNASTLTNACKGTLIKEI